MPLRALEAIRKRLAERPGELAEARAAGQKVVGWQGYNLPEEILHALGLIPIRIGAGGDDRLVEIGGRYISTKKLRLCPGDGGAVRREPGPLHSKYRLPGF